MKIGIFGGTFNPIHMGHLINAQYICEEFDLHQILFIPAKYPVHKQLQNGISAKDRMEMIRLAIDGNTVFSVSSIELDRETPSYSIYTARQLIQDNPGNEYYFILGYDAFNDIETWKDYEELFDLVKFIIMKRPGDKLDSKFNRFISKIMCGNNPVIEISSSDIRKRINEKKTIRYLVPESVRDYIMRKELYSR